jgi:tetratricopeptide (TPR) repeat protein
MMRKLMAVMVLVSLGCLSGYAGSSSDSTPKATIGSGSPAELLNAGRVDDVLKLLNTRLQSAPEDAQSHNYLSRTYFAIQRWDNAIAASEKAVALQPANSEYHMWLGRAYAEKADHSSFVTAAGLTKKIRQEFERAVELDANNINARSDLAEFYLEAPSFMGGGKDKARRQAEAMAQQDAAVAHWLQARIAEKDKRLDAAENEYKMAIAVSGNHGSYWLNLASYYRRQGRLNDMEAAVNSAINADKKTSNVLFDAAGMLFGAGRNFGGAANIMRKYLTGTSGPPVEQGPAFQAHYLLGEILEKQGDKQGALAEYRAALALAKDYDRARAAAARLQQ